MKAVAVTKFDTDLADDMLSAMPLSAEMAHQVFRFFKHSSLFRWRDANNDCEDRANAICILLDAWDIPNAKGWVFSGSYLHKQEGSLTNLWNYHVAAAVPVNDDGKTVWFVIDPATSKELITVERWAANITESGTSYHFIKKGDWYIFPAANITKDNWHLRDKRNYNWTMQGLSGINGASIKGRAQLAFHKRKVRVTADRFRKIMKEGMQDQNIAQISKQAEKKILATMVN